MPNKAHLLSAVWSKEELERRKRLRKELEIFDKALHLSRRLHGAELMAPINSYEDALDKLNTQISSRISKGVLEKMSKNCGENAASKLRFPVALFFVRGDRADLGAKLTEQVTSSFNYWDLDSGKDIDILLPGWEKDPNLSFDIVAFFEFRLIIEEKSKWEYSGETDILLLDYEYHIKETAGRFRFDKTITLCVEQMLRDKLIGSVDGLMQSLVKAAQETGNHGVWKISDKIGVQTFRRSLWNYVKKKFLCDIGTIYDELRPYAICNLEK